MGLILFRFLYFFLFFGLSTIAGMLIPFLNYKGYDPIQTGILISLYTVSGMIGQFAVGYFCDRLKTIKKIFLPSIIIIMISGTISIMFNIKALFIMGFIFMGCFNYILNTLCDSWVMERGEDIKKMFGPLRSYGSIGWAFGVLIAGFIISRFGYIAINILFLVSLFISLILAIRIKDTRKESSKSSNSKELVKNKEYVLTIIALLIIGVSYRGYCQVLPYTIAVIGGSTVNLGIYSFISAISETIMLMLCTKIMNKFSPDKMLVLSPIAILIQLSVLYFIPNIYVIYFSGLLQVFTYPLILMVARIMIDRVSPCNLKTSSQLIGFAIFNSFGIIIASLSVGFLVEHFSLGRAILSLITFTFIGIISAIIYDRNIKDKTL